jgi:hypothetical protein
LVIHIIAKIIRRSVSPRGSARRAFGRQNPASPPLLLRFVPHHACGAYYLSPSRFAPPLLSLPAAPGLCHAPTPPTPTHARGSGEGGGGEPACSPWTLTLSPQPVSQRGRPAPVLRQRRIRTFCIGACVRREASRRTTSTRAAVEPRAPALSSCSCREEAGVGYLRHHREVDWPRGPAVVLLSGARSAMRHRRLPSRQSRATHTPSDWCAGGFSCWLRHEGRTQRRSDAPERGTVLDPATAGRIR